MLGNLNWIAASMTSERISELWILGGIPLWKQAKKINRPKPPSGGLAVSRQLTRSANERVKMAIKLYTVKMTVELVVAAGNEFAAEAEAKEQIGLLHNSTVVKVNTVKTNNYMKV